MSLSKKESMVRYLAGSGIEIGALHNPLKVDTSRAKVSYVDLADKDFLEKQNPEITGQSIISPDIKASAEDMGVVKDGSLDFVILRHVLEHLSNPIKALSEIFRVLRTGGICYLSVPDKRYTFDKARPVTPLAHLLLDYEKGTTLKEDRGHYEEWLAMVELKKERPVVKTVEELLSAEHRIHFHVWEPKSIIELIDHLNSSRNIFFRIKDRYCKTGDLDLIYILEKKTKAPGLLNRVFNIH